MRTCQTSERGTWLDTEAGGQGSLGTGLEELRMYVLGACLLA